MRGKVLNVFLFVIQVEQGYFIQANLKKKDVFFMKASNYLLFIEVKMANFLMLTLNLVTYSYMEKVKMLNLFPFVDFHDIFGKKDILFPEKIKQCTRFCSLELTSWPQIPAL